jgi:hypothetical protein
VPSQPPLILIHFNAATPQKVSSLFAKGWRLVELNRVVGATPTSNQYTCTVAGVPSGWHSKMSGKDAKIIVIRTWKSIMHVILTTPE